MKAFETRSTYLYVIRKVRLLVSVVKVIVNVHKIRFFSFNRESEANIKPR